MQLPASESNSTLRSILLLVLCQLSREAAQKPAVMAAQRAAGLDLQCRKEMGSSWSCFCSCASRRCAGITMTYEQKKTVLSATRHGPSSPLMGFIHFTEGQSHPLRAGMWSPGSFSTSGFAAPRDDSTQVPAFPLA